MSEQFTNDLICRKTQSMISDYIDNALSARDTWEVEKHLAGCPECSLAARTTQATVEALRTAPTFDAGDEFMAKLHARLDALGPVPVRRSFAAAVRDWLQQARQHVNGRPIRTLSFGMATFVVAALLFSGKPAAVNTINPDASESVSQEALDKNVAVTASNPFDDPVAAKLEADSGSTDAGARAGTN